MSANTSNDFTFTLCVSQKGYGTKPTKEQVPTITFESRALTIEDALHCATEGRAFCYSFTTAKQDGIITIKDKKEANFLSTSTIIYDFDDMEVPMLDYIETLPFKPSFAYPTYSDGKNGFSRFRLAYSLEDDIKSVSDFNALYHAIAKANGFVKETKEHGGWDVRNVAQLYYGTTSTASTYNGKTVYSKEEFEPFITASTEQHRIASSTKETDYSRYESAVNPEFLQDFTHLPQKALYTKYRDIYYSNYEPSLSTALILDESEMFYRYPDDYVCVYHKRQGKYTLKWDIGEDRKKKMFITAQIMLFNLPELTIENLLYNLRLERQWYYDNSDGKINNEFLLQTAINAYNKPYPLEPSEHPTFSLNKPFWEGQGYTANQAKMIVRRELEIREVQARYNPKLTTTENYRILKEQGVRISLRTLQRMVTGVDIKIISPKTSHTYLSCCRDSDTIQILQLIEKNERITQSEIAAALNLSPRTVKRYMDAMKGVYIEREGNNRTGRWVILHPLPLEHQEQSVLKPRNRAKQPFISQRETCFA